MKRRFTDEDFSSGRYAARRVLDSVELWAAPGCALLRETEYIGRKEGETNVWIPGRLDGLLVPVIPWECSWRSRRGWCWDGARVVGVEVKVTAADLRRGLAEGQLQRYLECVGGLMLAVPIDLATLAKQLAPKEVGLLIVRDRNEAASCARRPTLLDVPTEPQMLWKILHDMNALWRTRRAEAYREGKDVAEAAGRAVRDAVAAAVRSFKARERA